MPAEKKTTGKIILVKTKELKQPDEKTVKLIIDFVQFAADFLKLTDKEIKIRLMHAAPKEAITTGAYEPATKRISVIIENRNFIDYCRTVAHEMVHMKQDYDGEVESENQEIGGKIEDDANARGGQIVKSYLKNHLKPEQKRFLGLGTF